MRAKPAIGARPGISALQGPDMSGRGFSMDYRPPCTSGPGMPGPYKAVQRQMGNRGKPPFF